jgi:hypothetical protein
LRLRLEVDIGGLGIELTSIPNQSSIDIGLQCQNHCLDVKKLLDGIEGADEYIFVFGCSCTGIRKRCSSIFLHARPHWRRHFRATHVSSVKDRGDTDCGIGRMGQCGSPMGEGWALCLVGGGGTGAGAAQ